jgi:hypothetical protein
VLVTIFGLSRGASANLPEGWWNERVFESDMVLGPRTAEFHAQLEIVGVPKKTESYFGHCQAMAVVRRAFKAEPPLGRGEVVILRGLCAGLSEKTAGIPIAADATTPPLLDLRPGQLVEAWFHRSKPDYGSDHFTTRLQVIPRLTETPLDPLPTPKP